MPAIVLSPFRLLLEELDGTEPSGILNYFRFVHAIGEDVVEEVAQRLLRVTASRGCRLLAVETAFYHPWPSWVDCLPRLLRHETDDEIFEVGVRALGRLGTPEAYEALSALYAIRQESAFQAILSWELVRTDPQQAFQTYLARLVEGSANPRVANDAANELAKLVTVDRLGPLYELANHEDLLIVRHALRLISSVLDPQVGEWMCQHLADNHRVALEDRNIKDWLNRFHMQPAPELLATALKELETSLGSRSPETYAMLASSQGKGTPPPSMDALVAKADGGAEVFFVRLVLLLREGKPSTVSAFLADVAEGLHLRARRTGYAIDTCALGLAQLVPLGHLDRSRVLSLLRAAYCEQTGREGVGRALGLLVEADDLESQDLILANQDSPSRSAALDAVGSLNRDDLLPFLLRACHDPIEDVAQRVILALGNLSGAREAALELLRASNLEDLYLGINIMALNRMVETVPMLLDFLETCTREETSVKVIQALGQMGASDAVAELLALLHSGQSTRMQLALAVCLRDIGDATCAVQLAERALEFRQPSILLVAIEALIAAGGNEASPMDESHQNLLCRLIQGVWEDRDPWPWRLRVVEALEGLCCVRKALYSEILQVVGAAVKSKRAVSAWSPEEQLRATNVFRILERRAVLGAEG